MPILLLRSVAVLTLLIPALALTSAVGGPVIIYLTALIALATMAVNLSRRWEPFALKELVPMAIALGVPLLVMFINNVSLGIWSSSEFEKLLRFALAIPVCWMLMRVPRNWLQHVQWSLLFGAVAGSLMLIFIVLSPSLGRGAVSDFGGRYNAVGFADLTIFFGLASLLTLPWTLSRWPRLEAALKLAAVPLSIYAVWVSQTRSSWALLVVFGVVYLLTKRRWTRRTKLLFLAGLVLLMTAVAAISWQSKDSRWKNVVSDLNRYEQHDRDTSVGIRIQLWKASWLMFQERPLVGVGVPNFRAELSKLEHQGVVTQEVSIGYGEPHNDMLGAIGWLRFAGSVEHSGPVPDSRGDLLAPFRQRRPGGACRFADRLAVLPGILRFQPVGNDVPQHAQRADLRADGGGAVRADVGPHRVGAAAPGGAALAANGRRRGRLVRMKSKACMALLFFCARVARQMPAGLDVDQAGPASLVKTLLLPRILIRRNI